MSNFLPAAECYEWRPHDRPVLASRTVEILSIDRIRRGPRTRQGGDFDRERMIDILRGIGRGDRLPPIEVYPLPVSDRFTHQLYDGFHRYCAAIAAGYSSIPTVLNGEWMLGR
jgi:hypothetical protein